MKRKKWPPTDLDRPFRADDPSTQIRMAFARMHVEAQKLLRRNQSEFDALIRQHQKDLEDLLGLKRPGPKGSRPTRRPTPKRPGPPKRKGGGSEAVTVEPNRPKLGEGGAAAALEFDE